MTDYKDCGYNTSKTASFVGNDYKKEAELNRIEGVKKQWKD